MQKNNKGFTLVELIVVIVILAILIGVTIGGIYKWVGQSRINTDMHNAEVIEKTLSLMNIDDYPYTGTFDELTVTGSTLPQMADMVLDEQGYGRTDIYPAPVTKDYWAYVASWKDALSVEQIKNNKGGTSKTVIVSKDNDFIMNVGGDSDNEAINDFIARQFPNGLPESKTGNGFTIVIYVSVKNGQPIFVTKCDTGINKPGYYGLDPYI